MVWSGSVQLYTVCLIAYSNIPRTSPGSKPIRVFVHFELSGHEHVSCYTLSFKPQFQVDIPYGVMTDTLVCYITCLFLYWNKRVRTSTTTNRYRN